MSKQTDVSVVIAGGLSSSLLLSGVTAIGSLNTRESLTILYSDGKETVEWKHTYDRRPCLGLRNFQSIWRRPDQGSGLSNLKTD
jgi:hypothetical protein